MSWDVGTRGEGALCVCGIPSAWKSSLAQVCAPEIPDVSPVQLSLQLGQPLLLQQLFVFSIWNQHHKIIFQSDPD